MFLDFFKATIPHNQASKFEQLSLWFFSNLTFLEHYFRTFFGVFSVVYRVINLPRVQTLFSRKNDQFSAEID